MNKLLKACVIILFTGCWITAVCSCHKDNDPDYDDVTPPEVSVENGIVGFVTEISGKPIQNATVTAAFSGNVQTAETDENGYYVMRNVKQSGTYAMKVVAEGKLAEEGEVTLVESKTPVGGIWNVRMAKAGREVVVSQKDNITELFETEVALGNEAAKAEIKVVLPAGVIAGTGNIILTPVYTNKMVQFLTKTFDSDDVLISGINLSCEGMERCEKPISINFRVNEELAEELSINKHINGKWERVAVYQENGLITLEADMFTTYAIFLPVSVSREKTTETLSFATPEFNNLYGSKDMTVENTVFNYKLGVEISDKGSDVATAFLLEVLGDKLGVTKSSGINGILPLNVTLPVGTKLSLKGTQNIDKITVSSKKTSVTCKEYGSFNISVSTGNRKHTGGSN